MKNVILSDEQILKACEASGYKIMPTTESKFKVSSKAIAKAAEYYLLKVLKEPCTGHIPDVIAEQLSVADICYEPELTAHYYNHRYLCPKCMAEIEKEVQR